MDPDTGNIADAISVLPSCEPASNRASGVAGGREIIVVLGMHRSGTSLLSNVLHYLGVDMADDSDQVSPSNPGGFWERPSITAIQDDILNEINRPIDDPRHYLPFPAGWWRAKGVQTQKRRLRSVVSENLARCPGLWGFKDPRTCRLLPLWWEIFEELGLQSRYVWAVRSPGESAASMAGKNPTLRPMTPALAEVSWLAYNYDVLRYTTAANRMTVVYQNWFVDPIAQTNHLLAHCKLPGLASETETLECIQDVVEVSYRRQHEGTGKALARLAISQSLFTAITSSDSRMAEDDLKSYVSLLDVIFRALSPFVDLLAEMPALRRDLRVTKKQLAKLALHSTATLPTQQAQWREPTFDVPDPPDPKSVGSKSL